MVIVTVAIYIVMQERRVASKTLIKYTNISKDNRRRRRDIKVG